ncbi:MAG: 5-methyltetrahydropteroyltriglutamate--homocysteine S-methyltransferase [Candidatus Ancillula sp.]|jgi:5-methyltetrahydropteroyltriglutamate--homocysteine methyltransferase|nr:5-methyltetrahydropteroyltriglutamate--homocysteine S-methyltransferase [Candidatus Ancillula sp.]
MNNFPKATIVGYPRIGKNRELKKAEESYWAGKSNIGDLYDVAKNLRLGNYQHLKDLGMIEDWSIPESFSYYDQMLDLAITFGAIPDRFEHLRIVPENEVKDENGQERPVGSFGEKMRRPVGFDEFDLNAYFTIARGDKEKGEDGLPAEMTKWFNTNYHYIVPEFSKSTNLSLTNYAKVRNFEEALNAGYKVRPVLVGPATFLALGKYNGITYKDLIDDLTACYSRLLGVLASKGCEWVQFDEPALISETHNFSKEQLQEICDKVYGELSKLNFENNERPKIFVTSPYGFIGSFYNSFLNLPVEALHIDFTVGFENSDLDLDFDKLNAANKQIVLGLVNGHNIWRADLENNFVKALDPKNVDNFSIGTSCSLQHVPHTIEDEAKLQVNFPALVSNLSFADEKIAEVLSIAGLKEINRDPMQDLEGRSVKQVHEKLTKIKPGDFSREPFEERKKAQHSLLNLPLLPTTTIGSFPQTSEIRKTRAAFKRGEISEEQYQEKMQYFIKACVELQEEIGLDVLVHGESERNDMVQYFAENFEGFDVTENGWVQSYGSRCTKPSILWGDVYRDKPFTVQWIKYAQSLTEKRMKGMLTGPVTILAWSFVREDQPINNTANQVALALRDEIHDLEEAGIKIIQVDEPALRELLPLRKSLQEAYLKWSVNSFKLATSSVAIDTQIHTHLCYSEFEVVLPAIIGLNADVTSIESARSKGEIVGELAKAKYPLEVGPGVYDIHSPRVPSVEEEEHLINQMVDAFKENGLPLDNLWVNPDCGLKTRKDVEVIPALKNMVAATLKVRSVL